MNGSTHITVGAALALGIGLAAGEAPGSIEWVFIAGSLAALAPDIDHPASTAGRRLPLLAFLFSRLGHRGLTHSALALAAVVWGMGAFAPSQTIATAAIAGFASHLVLDAMTPTGIQFLWPIPLRLKLLPRSLQFSLTEPLIHILSIFIIIHQVSLI